MVPDAPTVLAIAVEEIVAAWLPVTVKVIGIFVAVFTGAFIVICGVETAMSGGVVVAPVKFILQSSGPRTAIFGLPNPVTML